jgi:hypothetical protein
MTKTYFMARGRILRIQGVGSVVRVQNGGVWLTQEGDGRDYYLGEGSTLRLSSTGLVLAQATRSSSISLTAASPVKAVKRLSFGARLARWWFSLYARHAQPTTVSL